MILSVVGNRVLVRPDVAAAPSLPAGLIAPDNYIPEVPTTGEVIGVGLGFEHPGFPQPSQLIGRRVCFSPVSGQDIDFHEPLLILLAEDILGIFEEDQ